MPTGRHIADTFDDLYYLERACMLQVTAMQTGRQLRIVPQDLWDAVQARRGTYTRRTVNTARRPKHLLSGLTRCGVCGGS